MWQKNKPKFMILFFKKAILKTSHYQDMQDTTKMMMDEQFKALI